MVFKVAEETVADEMGICKVLDELRMLLQLDRNFAQIGFYLGISETNACRAEQVFCWI
ncbi:unnamed protein product [Prunus armeniaca]|uniref:Uncharacterized protein n=1 Tax=Prunus armeniaca TaxID=36596 RepID=A0A6J5Y927_PRUAR|nr:unnamed protein product [Prunus armeniaca]